MVMASLRRPVSDLGRSFRRHWRRWLLILIIIPLILYWGVRLYDRYYWGNMRHMFLSSAFFVTELPNNISMVRILAAGEDRLFNPKMSCRLDGGELMPANVKRLELSPGCTWQYFFVDCPAQSAPLRVAVVGDNAEHSLQLTPADPTPRRFVVCFSRLFFFERWQSALAALHLYKFHGVDLMVLPIISVITEMYRLLREYEADGRIRLKTASVVPKMPTLAIPDANAEVDWYDQVLNFNECLYEYRDAADFMAFVDLDDIIVPRMSRDLHSDMMFWSHAFPLTASFEFNWTLSSSVSPPNPRTFSLNNLIRSNKLHTSTDYGKSIVVPKRLREGFIHHPSWFQHEVLDGFEHRQMASNSTPVFVHLRHLWEKKRPDGKPSFFSKDHAYESVDRDFRQFLKDRPAAYEVSEMYFPTNLQAFHSLPKRMRYYEVALDCMSFPAFVRCHSPVVCQPKYSPDLPECVVLETRPHATSISSDLVVYTAEDHRLAVRETCLGLNG